MCQQSVRRARIRVWLVGSGILASALAASAQAPREFNKTVNLGGASPVVAFSVPSGSAPATGWPLIIGLHPAQTPAGAMRDMLAPPARKIRAVVACPEGPDGDGKAILPLVNWCKKNYKIDAAKVILTGYSAGGHPTFSVGLSNVTVFKGLIGIAPSVSARGSGFAVAAAPEIPVALITGSTDGNIARIKGFYDTCKILGGPVKLVEKPGVGHTGPYFWGAEFAEDWAACYKFCLETPVKPKPSSR